MTVQVGDQLPVWTLEAVDPARMKTMAVLLRDPNPIHFDTEVVSRLGLGDRPINQGPNNVGYVLNLLIDWLGDAAAIASIRVRFRGNVFAGDQLAASGRVTGIDEEAGRRRATCEVWLDRDDGSRVVSGTATVWLPERDRGSPEPG